MGDDAAAAHILDQLVILLRGQMVRHVEALQFRDVVIAGHGIFLGKLNLGERMVRAAPSGRKADPCQKAVGARGGDDGGHHIPRNVSPIRRKKAWLSGLFSGCHSGCHCTAMTGALPSFVE